MCSCHRDAKSEHSSACQRSKTRYNRSPKGYIRAIDAKIKAFERKTGVKI